MGSLLSIPGGHKGRLEFCQATELLFGKALIHFDLY